MNSNNHFTTLEPKAGGTFADQLQELKIALRQWLSERRLTPASLLMVRVYFTDAANQLEAFKAHSLYSHYLAAAGFSYVEQPLFGGAKVALQLWCVDGTDMKKTVFHDGIVVETADTRIIFQSVRFTAAEAAGKNGEEQTREAFARHIACLERYGMTLEAHCHRTWIYVRDIDRHYAGVVKGRNALFAAYGLTPETHFIASTGIGGYADNREAVVCMDFLSIDANGGNAVKYLHATDYLNPTAEYGVAFERGTALSMLGSRYRLISGTASIDCHGECLYRGNVQAQTERLFLNIEKLLEDDGASLADMAYMIVYLRDVADERWVRHYLDAHFPMVPYLITEARVCRPEWLIEVETIACTPEV